MNTFIDEIAKIKSFSENQQKIILTFYPNSALRKTSFRKSMDNCSLQLKTGSLTCFPVNSYTPSQQLILSYEIYGPILELFNTIRLKIQLCDRSDQQIIGFCMATRGKPAPKGPTKKKIQRPGLTEDEIEELREAFNLFDTEATGKIDPRQLKSAMQSLGFQSKNPTIFNVIADLESLGREVDFEEFLDGITSRLGDKETRVGINKIFDLFDDDHTGSINSNNIRRVAKELGETMNVQELQQMLQRASSNGREISRQDFYNIMTKKSF